MLWLSPVFLLCLSPSEIANVILFKAGGFWNKTFACRKGSNKVSARIPCYSLNPVKGLLWSFHLTFPVLICVHIVRANENSPLIWTLGICLGCHHSRDLCRCHHSWALEFIYMNCSSGHSFFYHFHLGHTGVNKF